MERMRGWWSGSLKLERRGRMRTMFAAVSLLVVKVVGKGLETEVLKCLGFLCVIGCVLCIMQDVNEMLRE